MHSIHICLDCPRRTCSGLTVAGLFFSAGFVITDRLAEAETTGCCDAVAVRFAGGLEDVALDAEAPGLPDDGAATEGPCALLEGFAAADCEAGALTLLTRSNRGIESFGKRSQYDGASR